MTEQIAPSILKRKVVAGRVPPDASLMSPAKALRIALAKAAQDVLHMPLVVEELSETRLSLAEMLDGVQDRALLAVLEGPGEGLGLIALSPQVLSALIEMQTMGRVTPLRGAENPRRPTRTDAAMAAGFIDAVLQEFETALELEPELVWAGGFRYASFLDDPRPLGLLLEDTGYRVFRLTLDLSLGARRGELVLVLPATGRGKVVPRPVIVADSSGWDSVMQQTVMGTPAVLEGVLHRVTLPLAAVAGLKVGDVVPLPMAALDRVQMEGVGGRRLVVGRLGQSRGHRAVRLSLTHAEAVTQDT